ncbi:hypothetical protein TBC1_11329 [Lentimicrobium saccharophilum]|uniref:Uncharacterized protein n=1 Tax=Lentimicrobium saccharophilum TaxID=1678841 RepID=A0A0S7BZT9_9BACT|nr:hypothetical protein TBC1_11329 [Lentimicrobium saccharophilum]
MFFLLNRVHSGNVRHVPGLSQFAIYQWMKKNDSLQENAIVNITRFNS